MTVWVPPVSFDAMETNLVNPATPFGTLVSSHATTAHTKNATYTELIASTAFETYGILIYFSDVGGTNLAASSMLVDLAIGGASSESVIISNLNAGYASAQKAQRGGQKYWFPLRIPAGSRLSATAQSLIVADDVRMAVWLFGKPNRPVWAGDSVVTYGADTSLSQGVIVATGASGAEGTYTQIVASTTRAHPYLAAGVGCAADTSVIDGTYYLDIGSGSATEANLLLNQVLVTDSSEALSHYFPISCYAHVASGVRLATRISQVSGVAQSLDVILYGVS